MLSMAPGSSDSVWDARSMLRETERKGNIHASVMGEELITAKGGVSALTLLDLFYLGLSKGCSRTTRCWRVASEETGLGDGMATSL